MIDREPAMRAILPLPWPALLMALGLACALAAGPARAQDTPSDRAPAEAEAPTEEQADAVATPVRAPEQTAAAPPAKKRWNPRKDENTPKFLGLAALLLLWLLARNEARRNQARAAPRRPQRRTPITPDELGHAAFHAAMDADLDEYRGLFLSGPEAAKVLGTAGAESYLNRRTLSALEDALADLAARIPQGAHFDHAALEGEDLCLITLRLPDQSRATLPLGSVVQVGRILRLREPSTTG